MPAQSKAQRVATAIAEHDPSRLYARNRGLLGMSQRQLHDFASTTTKNLPTYVRHGGAGHSHYTGYQRVWDVSATKG